MATETGSQIGGTAGAETGVVHWRREQLLAAAFPAELAEELAGDWRFDLHSLIELVEQGCEPRLAAGILAPLDDRLGSDNPERGARGPGSRPTGGEA
jgi:hypothetical protein